MEPASLLDGEASLEDVFSVSVTSVELQSGSMGKFSTFLHYQKCDYSN